MKKFQYQVEREAKFYRVLFSVFFLLLVNAVNANFTTHVISQSNGLISNNVKSVIKSSKDLIWIATDNGVSVYNGALVENYTVLHGLSHNNCWSIVEDNYTRIWVGTYGGGLSYFENGKFHTFSDNHFLPSAYVRKLFVKGKYLYVGTKAGLSIIDLKTKKIVQSQRKNLDIQIMDFFSYQGDLFVVSFKRGVFRLKDGNLRKVNQINQLSIFTVLLDGETLYFGLAGKIKPGKSIAKIAVKDFLLGKNNYQFFGGSVVWDLVKTKNDIFAGSSGGSLKSDGLYQFRENNLLFENNFSKTVSKNIQCLSYDQRTNVLFAGSIDLGLFIIDLDKNITRIDKNNFLFYKKNNDQSQVTCTKSIFQYDDHKLTKSQFCNYLSTHKDTKEGKKQIDLTKDYRNFNLADQNFQHVFEIKSCVFEDDNFYVNTTLGIFRVLFEKGILTIKDCFPFSASVIFINNHRLLFQTPHNSFKSYSLKDNEKSSVRSYSLSNENNPRDVFKIFKLGGEVFAFSHFKGVFKYENDSFRNILKNKNFKSKELILAKKANRNTALLVNREGSIFSFIKFNNEVKLKKILSLNSLIGDAISDIYQKDSLLFVATNLGLNVFHLATQSRYFLDEENGLPGKEIKRIDSFRDSIFIFTKKGLHTLKSSFITKQHDCGDFSLEAVLLNGLKVESEKDEIIEIDKNQNNLKLVLSTKGAKYPSKIYYKYSINGEDDFSSDWKKLIENKSFTIPFIPYGLSEITLKTNNLFTGNQHEYKFLTIYKSAPFYKTKLFYLFLTVLFSAFSFYIVKRRFKRKYWRQKEKSILEKRLQEAKMQALTSQMSPHFIFNSLNSIQSFVLNNNTEMTMEYINSFSVLIRSTLNYSSRKYITLQQEINYLDLYVKIQNLRFGNKIQFVKIIHESVEIHDVVIPPLLLQPIIENCFEHAFDNLSQNPKIKLNINFSDTKMTIQVKDNGGGFKETQHEESKGLKLAEERIKILGKDNILKIESSSSGTNVLLILNH
jgi:two-component sensor histidine kinase